jgi:hypothetical protein
MPSNSLTPLYLWNAKARRYVDVRSRRFVSNSAVRGALEELVSACRDDMERVTRSLAAGNVSLAEWQIEMARLIKIGHVASTAAARGGWAQMSQSDWGYTGHLVRRQYWYLNRLAGQIETGAQPLSRGLLRRVGMYGQAMRGSYQSERRRLHHEQAFDEERRVRGIADSCPDCIRYAAQGWQPIGTLPAIGESRCLTLCHCYFQYRRRGGEVSE